MARRAPSGFPVRLPLLALTVGLAAATLQLGCGGGGGGGGTVVTGDCGTTGTVPNLCGKVVGNLSGAAVSGATVYLKSSDGTTLTTTTTNSTGWFYFSAIPAGTKLFWVNPPSTGFNANMNTYATKEYMITRTNLAGTAPCVMSVGTLPTAGDKSLGTVTLSQDGGPPGAPVFDCPI